MGLSNSGFGVKRTTQFVLIALLVALVAWHVSALLSITTRAHPFDTTHSYVPAARAILADGWLHYVRSEAALRISPLSALWFASVAADANTIQTLHIWLSGACVVLIGLLALQIGGRVALVIAAAMWTFSPNIRAVVPFALTEAPYLFLLLLWMWFSFKYVESHQRIVLLAVGAFGGLCILMRPFLLYPAGAILVIALIAAISTEWWKHRGLRATLSLLAATLIIPLGVMTANKLQHGVFALSVGGGAALYQGLHPHTGGFEPAHFKLVGDIELTLGAADHLTINADQQSNQIAKAFLRDRTFDEWRVYIFSKTSALLFHHISDVRTQPNLRAWRLALIPLAIVGVWFWRHSLRMWLCAVTTLLMGAQLIPALHTARYSIAALEPGLILLAALGVAGLVRVFSVSVRTTVNDVSLVFQKPAKYVVLWLAAISALLAALAISVQHSNRMLRRTPDNIAAPLLPAAPAMQTVFSVATPRVLSVDSGRAVQDHWVLGDEHKFAANYNVQLSSNTLQIEPNANAFWIFDVESQGKSGAACQQFELAFRDAAPSAEGFRVEPFAIEETGQTTRVAVSATPGHSNVAPRTSGTLRIVATCAPGSAFRLSNLSLRASTVRAYGREVLRKK